MKFTNDANINGTSLKGYIKTTYAKLFDVFGEPYRGPDDAGDKVTCEWRIQFDDGTIATIYDWKLDSTPFEEYRWHIGGHDMDAVDRVLAAMDPIPAELYPFIKDAFAQLNKEVE